MEELAEELEKETPIINDNDIVTVHDDVEKLDIMIKGDKFKRLYNADKTLLLESWRKKYNNCRIAIAKGGIKV